MLAYDCIAQMIETHEWSQEAKAALQALTHGDELTYDDVDTIKFESNKFELNHEEVDFIESVLDLTVDDDTEVEDDWNCV